MQRPALIARMTLLALGGLLVFSCTRRPAEPRFDNPFDPANPTGDPFALSAQFVANEVILHWNVPRVTGITDYEILRSVQSAGPFALVGRFPATAAARQTATDTKFARNGVNYYKVLALHGHDITAESRLVSTGVFVPASITIRRSTTAAADSTVPSRQAHLILRSNFGDSVDVASTSDFAGAQRFAATDTSTILAWDLGPASRAGERKRVFARLRTGSVLSSAVRDSASAELTAKVRIVGQVINDTLVIRARGTGFTRLRSAAPQDSLELAPWVVNPRPDLVDSIQVLVVVPADTLAPFVIRADVESDFGFTRRFDLPAAPLSVDTLGLSFKINNADSITSNPVVTITSIAKHATQMRFSENADFTGVPWQPFRATSTFSLAPVPGVHRLYGIFRNPFEPFGFPVSRSIKLVGTPTP